MSINTHISLKQLCKSFDNDGKKTVAFKDLTLSVKKGEFVAILGPSGCGKSTLLRVLAGLEAPSSGDYSYNDQIGESRAFSMIFQEHGLFPWMTLEQNISFILENNAEIDRNNVSKISKEYLAIVGLTDYANFYPHQVSGGMKQRVSVARSFANNPAILFMDEPFVFLDFQSRFLLHELLLKIWNGSNKTVLFVTHDIEEAVMLSDRIIVLSGQPGSIIADEAVDIPRPRDLITTRKSPEFIAKVDKYIQIIRNDIRL